MDLFADAFNPRAHAADPSSSPAWNDFWYRDDLSGYMAETGSSGIALSAEAIMKCGTVLAAVRFRGDSWAMCPPSVYKKTPTGRKEVPDHYAQRVLRNPNAWQTGNRWRHLNGVWMATWGNAYNEIISGRASFAEELRPLYPGRTRVVDQRADGSLVYEYRAPGEEPRQLGQERVLHFRDISTDGIQGLEMYKLIRNVVGIALLAERHASTFLKKGARLAGLIVPTKNLGEKERTDLRDSINADLGGTSNTGTFGIMPFGVDIKPIASTNRDSQLQELSDQVIGAILRFLGVPGVVVGWMGDKTSTYASADAFFEKGGLKHCVLPIIINVEAEEEKALLLMDSGLQIKHNLDVLLRASTKDRYEALAKAAGGPWMSRNEVRRIEDLNEDPDPDMDKILTPSNMAGEVPEPDPGPPDEPPPPPPPRPAPAPEERAPDPRLELLTRYAHDNAVRIVRRELKALEASAKRHARSTAGWKASVLELYGEHVEHVAEVMRISKEQARGYCDSQAAEVLAQGAAALKDWEDRVPPRLAALALGGEA